MIRQIGKQSHDEVFYDVDGVKVRLWLIVGGTPALGIEDPKEGAGIVKRFGTDPKLSSRPGVLTYEVLPNGEKDIVSFVDEVMPMVERRKSRDNVFKHFKVMKAPIFEDADGSRCILRVKYDFPWAPRVRIDGDCDVYKSSLPDAWKELAAVLEVESGEDIGSLSNAEYWEMVKALNACAATATISE